jgi:hypothetical protein
MTDEERAEQIRLLELEEAKGGALPHHVWNDPLSIARRRAHTPSTDTEAG